MVKYVLILVLCTSSIVAQTDGNASFFVDATYYYGSLLNSNKDVAQVIRNQPEGVIFGFHKKTSGDRYWHRAFGYPDWGFSLGYQDFGSSVLGKNIVAYGHFNFYFLKRKLQFRIAQGLGVNTAPFNYEDNFKNNAYGSTLVASTYFMLQYQQRNIYKGFGVQTGLSFVHHSNGSFKAPNSGTNLVALNLGIQYEFDSEERDFNQPLDVIDFNEPIHINLFLRSGINEGETVGLGQYPFLVAGAFLDKRLSYKSTIQLGGEVFFSKFLEKEIENRAIAFFMPELADTDYKRIAVFAGYDFRVSKISIPMQLGYYVYWPYEYISRIYERIGIKYRFAENYYATFTVKAHIVDAEAVEFGVGFRL